MGKGSVVGRVTLGELCCCEPAVSELSRKIEQRASRCRSCEQTRRVDQAAASRDQPVREAAAPRCPLTRGLSKSVRRAPAARLARPIGRAQMPPSAASARDRAPAPSPPDGGSWLACRFVGGLARAASSTPRRARHHSFRADMGRSQLRCSLLAARRGAQPSAVVDTQGAAAWAGHDAPRAQQAR